MELATPQYPIRAFRRGAALAGAAVASNLYALKQSVDKAKDYQRAKRRIDFANMSGRMGQFAAGATNVVQRGFRRIKSGRKPNRNAKLALKFIESSQGNCILRYQRLGAYEKFPDVASFPNGPGSLSIAHQAYTTGVAPDVESFDAMPVHVFDLTSTRYVNISGSALDGSSQFQLVKFTSATGTVPNGPTGAYYWKSWNGQGPQGNTSYHWQVERNPIGGSTPYTGGQQYLDWVDVRLALFGARGQTTKFTVSLIQFNDRSYDPLCSRNLTTPVDNMRSVEEQRNYDAAWDEFCQPLIYHPMSSAGSTKIQLFKTLMKKDYVIAPDTNTNEDTAQPNLCIKFFKRMNRMCNYAWDDTPTARTGEQLDGAVFNTYISSQNKAYLHPRAKVFLMVTAQCYTRVTTETINASTTPTFDCIIRKKILYDRS